MTTARKMFMEVVTLPAITPTSLGTLMKGSIQHWWLDPDLATPAMDASSGDEASITPQATVFLGNDANVRDVNATPFYQGITVAVGQTYLFQDFAIGGVIDPWQIYFYSQSGCNMAVMFHGR